MTGILAAVRGALHYEFVILPFVWRGLVCSKFVLWSVGTDP
jgi:hypothetical protein